MIHGAIEGRDDAGRLLHASGSVGGRGSVRFQFPDGSITARYYSSSGVFHLDLVAPSYRESSTDRRGNVSLQHL